MSDYYLIYKFKVPEGYYGCKCRILSHGQRDRVLLEFEDGRKLMRSKFSVTSESRFKASQEAKVPSRIKCRHCNGRGWIGESQLTMSETDGGF